MSNLPSPTKAQLGRTKLLLFSLVLSLGLTGCSWTDKGGTHHLIVGVGFGVITTSTNCPGVQISESQVLGVQLGPNFSGVGLLQHHQVELDPSLTNNVVISINSNHGGLSITNFNPQQIYTNIFIQTSTKQSN